ncbi:MarR family transcriptional regulator [Microbacterium sp. STN6]|uniref:MarR family winged helix-turn-helix transcriptional regulator n=1 Tax=Microbacterium sp. STN6 TaxID=2995588 RepID=UPI002260FF24|nr:MarR family transcriptional regulator [Microbacterium sp. STN6]MCX7523303.1 MarR family transcriptional regulator [Microbacterium sp. STN6]
MTETGAADAPGFGGDVGERSAGGVTLLYLTKQLELAVRSQLDEVVSAESLTSLQYTALTVLERHPGLTSAELARNSFVRAQTTAQMVNALDERGLIERLRDPASKRQYLLSLTDDGARVLDRLREPVADIERRMVAGLDDSEIAAFRRALRYCRVAIGGVQAH